MWTAVKHFLRYQLPAIVWAFVIFIGSSIPERNLPRFIRHIDDKVVHGVVFFILGLLIYRALEIRTRPSRFAWVRIAVSILAVIGYGASDEFHQIFVPGRTPDFQDALADTVGGVFAALVIVAFQWRISHRQAGI